MGLLRDSLSQFWTFYLCVHIPAWVYVLHVCPHDHCGQRWSDPLKIELQMVVSYLMWVLGPNSGPLETQPVVSPAVVTNDLNSRNKSLKSPGNLLSTIKVMQLATLSRKLYHLYHSHPWSPSNIVLPLALTDVQWTRYSLAGEWTRQEQGKRFIEYTTKGRQAGECRDITGKIRHFEHCGAFNWEKWFFYG